jgi:hypothetical protein
VSPRLHVEWCNASRQVERIEIGLSIKLEGRGLYVPGYARRADRGWDYSELTKQIFAEYKREFPEVFEHLEQHADAQSFDAATLFGAEHVQRVEQVTRWLKRQPTAKIPLMPLTVRFLRAAATLRFNTAGVAPVIAAWRRLALRRNAFGIALPALVCARR